jgi:HSP20 family protein
VPYHWIVVYIHTISFIREEVVIVKAFVPTKWKNAIKQMGQNMANTLKKALPKLKREQSENANSWSPTIFQSFHHGIELDARGKELVARAVLPSVGINDFKVDVIQDRLVIRGCKSRSCKHEGRGYSRYEEDHVSFAQAISLPCEVDPDRVKATYKNGVLAIRLSKSEKATSKRIKIPVAV